MWSSRKIKVRNHLSWLPSEVLIYVLDSDRTPQGIVEGAVVVCLDNGHPISRNSLKQLTLSQFTREDVLPVKEIYKGRGYRVQTTNSTAKPQARAFTIKRYERNCAKEVGIRSWEPDHADLLIWRFKRCLAAAIFSQGEGPCKVQTKLKLNKGESFDHFEVVLDEGNDNSVHNNSNLRKAVMHASTTAMEESSKYAIRVERSGRNTNLGETSMQASSLIISLVQEAASYAPCSELQKAAILVLIIFETIQVYNNLIDLWIQWFNPL